MAVPTARPPYTDFRRRLKAREHLLGTFLKIATTHVIEILGAVGFDFVVIDQEHASFDKRDIDLMVLAARGANIAPIVRVGDPSDGNILSVLDCGATGILVPHVDTPEKARAIAGACRYRGGHRGFANTTRAGGFGDASFADHIATQDAQVICIAMIEDVAAVERAASIAAVNGIDAFFIGRGDLTAAIGAPSMTSPETHKLVAPIMAAALEADMPVIMLSPDRADALAMAKLGASAFMVASDHGFLKQAARQALKDFTPPIK
jgi:staphyloferrin B biosynthesis citrate synthase